MLASGLVIAGMLLLMFLDGISLIAPTHQFIWMQTSSASLELSRWPWRWSGLGRDEANRIQEMSSLKEFGVGLHTYHDTFNSLPPGGTMTDDGELLHGFAIMSIFGMNYYPEGIDYGVPLDRAGLPTTAFSNATWRN